MDKTCQRADVECLHVVPLTDLGYLALAFFLVESFQPFSTAKRSVQVTQGYVKIGKTRDWGLLQHFYRSDELFLSSINS